jgi:hypothetical protein
LVWFHFAKITLYSDISSAHRENPLTRRMNDLHSPINAQNTEYL